VDEWKKKCPIKRFKEYLIKNKVLTVMECDAIEQDAFNKVEEAAKFALESPEPDPARVMDDVFCEN
jgi:TPP-dependent pyruvate/acetoin dehydrogenase alpha subunit